MIRSTNKIVPRSPTQIIVLVLRVRIAVDGIDRHRVVRNIDKVEIEVLLINRQVKFNM